MKTAREILNRIYKEVDMSFTGGLLHAKLLDGFEEYAQYKVNELNKSDVIKSVCEHKWKYFYNETGYCIGGECYLCGEKR